MKMRNGNIGGQPPPPSLSIILNGINKDRNIGDVSPSSSHLIILNGIKLKIDWMYRNWYIW